MGNFIKYFIDIICFIIIIFIVNTKSIHNLIKYKISYKISSYLKFKHITKDMFMNRCDSFTIYYNSTVKVDTINFINNTIQKISRQKNDLLGEVSKYPLNIVLFSTKDEFNDNFRSESYKNAVSIYGYNTIYLCSDALCEHSVIHEYNHYIFDSFCKDKKISNYSIPAWFQEGLAEYSTFLLTKKIFMKKLLPKVISFRQLDTPIDIAKAYADSYDVYAQDYLAIKKIISIKKENLITNILIQSKTMNFYDALEKYTNESIENIEKSIKSKE